MGAPETKALERLQRQSTAAEVARRIREGIMRGVFSPGSQLGEAELATQLGVSRGPIREALQRLVQEGLLRSEPSRGAFVMELRRNDVEDIYAVRAAIEQAAVALVLDRSTIDEVVTSLRELVLRMDDAVAEERWAHLLELDLDFHRVLVSAAGSPRLDRIIATLLVETRMCLTRLLPAYAAPTDLVMEHRELVDALGVRDKRKAMRAVHDHMQVAAEMLDLP